MEALRALMLGIATSFKTRRKFGGCSTAIVSRSSSWSEELGTIVRDVRPRFCEWRDVVRGSGAAATALANNLGARQDTSKACSYLKKVQAVSIVRSCHSNVLSDAAGSDARVGRRGAIFGCRTRGRRAQSQNKAVRDVPRSKRT